MKMQKPIQICSILAVVLFLGIPTGSEAGLLDYNIMNCMDFSRHLFGSLPSRMGLFRRAELSLAVDKSVPAERRRFVSGLLERFQHLFSTVTNVGDQNVINCVSSEPFNVCLSIDDFLQQNFPEWFFEYQLTHNLNHVLGQITESPYHALFEAGLKAYACFCTC